MKVKLVKLSMCNCGHPVLADHISIGTEYEINPKDMASCTLICGGCSTKIKCVGVMTESRNGAQAGYLPREIFSE